MPVVAANASGIIEVVEDGVGGILSPPGDTAAMAEATAALLTDVPRRRAMGHAAARHAARYEWAASGELMLSRYHSHAAPVPPRAGVGGRGRGGGAAGGGDGCGDGDDASEGACAARPPPPLWERLHPRWLAGSRPRTCRDNRTPGW